MPLENVVLIYLPLSQLIQILDVLILLVALHLYILCSEKKTWNKVFIPSPRWAAVLQ